MQDSLAHNDKSATRQLTVVSGTAEALPSRTSAAAAPHHSLAVTTAAACLDACPPATAAAEASSAATSLWVSCVMHSFVGGTAMQHAGLPHLQSAANAEWVLSCLCIPWLFKA